jgi:hypothetical protein
MRIAILSIVGARLMTAPIPVTDHDHPGRPRSSLEVGPPAEPVPPDGLGRSPAHGRRRDGLRPGRGPGAEACRGAYGDLVLKPIKETKELVRHVRKIATWANGGGWT